MIAPREPRRFRGFASIGILFWFGFVASGCGSRTRVDPTILSPDGSRRIVTSINRDNSDRTRYLCVRFKIVDAQDHVEFDEQTGASDRMRWSIRWTDDRSVVLESSDIGKRIWKRGLDGRWTQDDPQPPNLGN